MNLAYVKEEGCFGIIINEFGTESDVRYYVDGVRYTIRLELDEYVKILPEEIELWRINE